MGLLAISTVLALSAHGPRRRSLATPADAGFAPSDNATRHDSRAYQDDGASQPLAVRQNALLRFGATRPVTLAWPSARLSSTMTADASLRASLPDDGSRVNQQPDFPIRATFYYPWFPEVWTVNGAHVLYHPVLGYYDSSDPAVQRTHIATMSSAGLDAAIASWWGFPNGRDARVSELLDQTVAMNSPLKWAVYQEGEGRADPTPEEIARDLRHIRELAESPAYLRIEGRFVVFVYNAQATDGCDVVDRWNAANELIGDEAYIQLLIFPGYRTCPSQPDSWHEYAPAHAASERPGYSYMVSPGFWRADEAEPRLERDLARWRQNVQDMVSSGEPWQLVVSFNEWGEGTAVESSREWGATYLAALRDAIRSAPKR